MKDIENLIKWFFPFYIIHAIVEYLLGYMLSNSLGAHGKKSEVVGSVIEQIGISAGEFVGWLTFIIPIFERFENVVVAVWLYFVVRKNGDNSFLWAIFGIVSGLMAIVIYYIVKIYLQQKQRLA